MCPLLTEDVSGASFDGATLGLTGHVTGSFLGTHDGLHTFDLAFTDLPTATWLFTNNHVSADPPFTDFDSGTYNTGLSPVPEPSTLLLFGSGLLGALAFRRRPVRR